MAVLGATLCIFSIIEKQMVKAAFFLAASEALLTISEPPMAVSGRWPSPSFSGVATVVSGLWGRQHLKEHPPCLLSFRLPQLVGKNRPGLGGRASGSWVCSLGARALPVPPLTLSVAVHLRAGKRNATWATQSACGTLMADIWADTSFSSPKLSAGERRCIA